MPDPSRNWTLLILVPDKEQSAVDLLHRYAETHGYTLIGRQSEVYLPTLGKWLRKDRWGIDRTGDPVPGAEVTLAGLGRPVHPAIA